MTEEVLRRDHAVIGGLRRGILFDRDGVLNHLIPGGYVLRPDEFKWLSGAREALRQATQSGWVCAVVTNQACIGRGLASAAQIEEIHNRMAMEAAEAGGRIERAFVCPHKPEDGCRCRKPQPGLLLAATRELGLDPGSCWVIGDAVTDLQAAHAVGMRFLVVRTGLGAETIRLYPDQEAAADVSGAVGRVVASL